MTFKEALSSEIAHLYGEAECIRHTINHNIECGKWDEIGNKAEIESDTQAANNLCNIGYYLSQHPVMQEGKEEKAIQIVKNDLNITHFTVTDKGFECLNRDGSTFTLPFDYRGERLPILITRLPFDEQPSSPLPPSRPATDLDHASSNVV